MINEMYKDMTGKGSVIREFFTYANKKAAEIGAENIFNFSIGNPSVPVPQEFTDYMIELLLQKMLELVIVRQVQR